LHQPTAGRALDTENSPVGFSENLPDPEMRAAPVLAQHTREVARELLNIDDDEINRLVENGDLELAKKRIGPFKQKVKTAGVSLAIQCILKYNAIKHSASRSDAAESH
jgi:hypothetical protein